MWVMMVREILGEWRKTQHMLIRLKGTWVEQCKNCMVGGQIRHEDNIQIHDKVEPTTTLGQQQKHGQGQMKLRNTVNKNEWHLKA